MIKCTKCGCSLNNNEKFCPECESKVELQSNLHFCSNCGAKRIEGGNFCPNCGLSFNIENTSKSTTINESNYSKNLVSHNKKGDRMPRLDYFFLWLLSTIVGGLGTVCIEDYDPVVIFLGIIFIVIGIGVGIYAGVRRLHDLNYSGFAILLGIIPFVNIALWLFMFFVKGTDGPNKYGEDPLA